VSRGTPCGARQPIARRVTVWGCCRASFLLPGGGSLTYAEMLQKEGYSDGTVGAVQTFFFRREDGPWTPESLATLTGVDVVIRLSAALGALGIYPAVDLLTSRSRLLDAAALGREHAEVAERARQALALLASDPAHADPVTVGRARKLQRFFAQPFFCAEPYTHRPGVTVSVSDALRGCREILDGLHDDVPKTSRHPSLRTNKYDETRDLWQARATEGWRFYFPD